MKINSNLLEMAWPEMSSQFTSYEKVLQEFVEKYEAKDKVSLAALIDFGSREDTPSLMLTEEAARALTNQLCYRCRSDTWDSVYRRVRRTFGLFPRFHWAERIHFHSVTTVIYTGGQDCIAEIKRIRKDILGS